MLSGTKPSHLPAASGDKKNSNNSDIFICSRPQNGL